MTFPTHLRALAASLDATTLEYRGIEPDALLARLSAMAADIERMADGIEPRNDLNSITPAQARVLAFVRQFIAEKGIAPTRQEVGDGLGLAPNGVQEHLLKLQRKGLLELMPYVARGIRLNKRVLTQPGVTR